MNPPASHLHVLMTTDAVGGIWTYTTALARALCRLGHRVTLVTLGPEPRAAQLRPLRDIPHLNLEITELALEWMDPEGHNMPAACERLAKIERRFRPDVVHINGYRDARAEWSAPTLVVAHSCVRSWWIACRGCEPTEARWRNYAFNVEAGLAAATQWVAPTAAFRDTVQALYAPPSIGTVIHNGLDVEARPSRREPFVLAAGRLWDEAKNMSALAEAAAGLSWPVRIAGATRSPDFCSVLAKSNELELLGELQPGDLLAEMHRAGIFVAPALYEPFGLTVLEAAASGCALVLSDIPSFREIWTDAALFVDPRNPKSIRGALHRLCADATLRHELQQAAKRQARRYSLTSMTQRYCDIYEALASSRARRAPFRIEAARMEALA